MKEVVEPIAVKFPLSGEWCAVNTPGEKVPSHGTDWLGQTYAYDFFQIDWSKKGYKFYKSSILSSLIFGAKLEDTYCWSQPILAPFEGEVIEAKDGVAERTPVHIVRDLLVVLKNGFFFRGETNDELHPVLGNFIILKRDDGVYCLLAHARTGSVKVEAGQRVIEGQKMAEVGHSGNSTAPHLHFQLMDSPNLIEAKGLPCCFKNYKVCSHDSWVPVDNGVPGKRVRIYA
ncbi:MAG: M23 family metallopeptidase [Candidatus Thiodiazotropha sp. (ex Myrtea spinifera)]|nr:M23 family metallopeptidase [Candidatus Thiodiazotropha sp. (ex Myrtea spinifera)]